MDVGTGESLSTALHFRLEKDEMEGASIAARMRLDGDRMDGGVNELAAGEDAFVGFPSTKSSRAGIGGVEREV